MGGLSAIKSAVGKDAGVFLAKRKRNIANRPNHEIVRKESVKNATSRTLAKKRVTARAWSRGKASKKDPPGGTRKHERVSGRNSSSGPGK